MEKVANKWAWLNKWHWNWFRKFAHLRYCKHHRTITPWWRRCCWEKKNESKD